MTSPSTDRRLGLAGNTIMKAPVSALAAGNITQYGEQTVDGYACLATNSAGVPDRVLCTGMTDATKNGIWDVSTAAWTRSVDANGNYDLAQGTTVLVNNGATYGGSYWKISTSGKLTIGSTLIAWARALANSLSTLSFLQAGTGAVARDAQGKMREWVTPQDFMTDAQKADVAARTRTLDVTAAIVAMFASGAKNFMFPPGDYKVTKVEGTPLISWVSQNDVQVIGFGARIYDPLVYTLDAISAVFHLDGCKRFKFIGLNYEGVPLANPDVGGSGIGYLGATFVNLRNGCEDIELDANLQDLRYGMRSGSYPTPADGYNKHLRIKLRTLRCGYPQAHYLAEDVKADIYAESGHRASYLAGVKGFDVNVRFKDQHIAPIQVIVSDATTNGLAYPSGTSRGSSAGRVWSTDMGSTTFVANSWCAGIAMSRADPGTTFEDIEFHFSVVGTDSVATTLGGFVIVSSITPFAPSYPFNWEQTVYLKNIKVSGIVDRSAQTIASHGVGELYINTIDSGAHYATVTGLDISGVTTIAGAGASVNLFCQVPGLTDQANVQGCNFGTYPLEFGSAPTKPFKFVNCAPITKTSVSTGETSALNFVNTDVTVVGQPVTNATFENSKLLGAAVLQRTKIIDVALAGASVTSANAIPSNCIVLGITGVITTNITGASGYQVGAGGDPTRYGDRVATAAGTAMPAIGASTDTGPRNYGPAADLVITAKTSNFTGGALRLAIHYLQFSALT